MESCFESVPRKIMGATERFFGPRASSSTVARGLVAFLVLANMVAVSTAQTNVTGSEGVVSDGRTDKPRPIEEGLRPLYVMTKIFLENVVQPNTYQNLNIDLAKIQAGQIQWTEWTLYFVGFVVCIIIGLLFIIIMPIVGLCFCCCRCCGRCGGRASLSDPKRAKCKRVSCGVLLLIITTVMLAGVICAFMTNELIREQTGDNNGLLPTIRSNLLVIDQYKDRTVKEIQKTLDENLRYGKSQIMNTLEELPDKAVDELGKITNATNLLNNAETLANSLTDMRNMLGNVSSTVDDLRAMNLKLSSELSIVKDNTTEALKSCFSTECNEIRSKLSLISTDTDFSQVDDVKDELSKVQSIYNENLPRLINQGKESFHNITKKLRSDASLEIAKADQKLDEVITEVNKTSASYISQLNQFSLAEVRGNISSVEPQVRQIGQYIWYVGIGLSCVILLIALLNCLGLLFGACGERPYDDATVCNKGVGANLLMAGVGFSFIFCWLLMLVTTIMFALFGMVHTEVCQHIHPPDRLAADNYLDSVVDQALPSQMNLKLNISSTIMGCKKNQPIYQALNLDSVIKLNELINTTQVDVKSVTDSILNSVGQIPSVTVISDDALKQLEDLEKAGLETINFTSYYHQLDKQLTATNLTAFAIELDQVAQSLNQSATAAIAADIKAQSDALRTIESTLVPNMTAQKDKLKVDVSSLQNLIDDGSNKFNEKVNSLVKSLNDTQNRVRGQGTQLLKQALQNIVQSFVQTTDNILNTLITKMTSSVGRCRPLYEASEEMIKGVCVTFLSPVNGFWFALGWCLFFFIPSIILAVKLAGLYRKIEPYDPYAFNKTFDDPYMRTPMLQEHVY